MTAIETRALAPDPVLPGRDRLLDGDEVAQRLPDVLGADPGVRVERCERVRVKYRIGESVRVLYRVSVGGEDHLVTARLFPAGRSGAAFERATDAGASRREPSGGPLRALGHDPELGAVWWTFPRDRKLGDLRWLTRPDDRVRRALGRDDWRRTAVAHYAPERSVTARAVNEAGATLAYAKVSGPEAVPPSVMARRYRNVADGLRRADVGVRAPMPLAWSDARRVLLLEVAPGRPWSMQTGEPAADVGRALAALHDLPAAGLPAFGRLRPDRVAHAADLVSRARPDLAAEVTGVARRLRATGPTPAPWVGLHGDCHPGNVLTADGVVSLIDLDQRGRGPAAADLGSLIARLRSFAVLGELTEDRAAELETGLLAAYAERRPLPDPADLVWHTGAALLAERALRAVNRVDDTALARLGALVAAAADAVDAGGPR